MSLVSPRRGPHFGTPWAGAACACLAVLPVCARASAVSGQAPPALEPPRTVGLALSGGSAKGIAHVGVLRSLERLGVRVDVVAGTSMGAVVGGLYALGLSVDSIEHVIAGADWSALRSDAVPRSRRFLDQRRLDERAIISVPLEERRVALPTGAIVGSNILRLLEHATWGAATVRRFSDLRRPFMAVATDLETGEAVQLRTGVLAEALRASSAVPGAIEPFPIGDRLLVDGALSRNLPASDARDLGADFVICSDVSSPLESAEELRSVVDVLSQLWSLSLLETTMEQRQLCDVLIQPDVEGMSGLDFERVAEWVERGVHATEARGTELEVLSARKAIPQGRALDAEAPRLIADSVLVNRTEVRGSIEPRVLRLVARELEVEDGAYVSRMQLEERLGDVDATGLFGLVRYRLDEDDGGGVTLTVDVEERPRDRLGVGLRYDDEREAALLFTATVHNLARYGSVTRFDLRVGQENHIGVSVNRRRGVTGRFGVGLTAEWSQAPLALGPQGGASNVEISSATAHFGLGAGRATFAGLEIRAERSMPGDSLGTVELVSGAAVFEHETLDRIDFPRRGAHALGRVEWGGTNVSERSGFSSWSLEARYLRPLLGGMTLDLGGMAGFAQGPDLPPHRRFYLGGVHRSDVFRAVHAPFRGLDDQERSGQAVQVARVGLQLEVGNGLFIRAGANVGGVGEEWTLPLEDMRTGWGLALGTGSLVGPVLVELSSPGSGWDPHLSVSVGRDF